MSSAVTFLTLAAAALELGLCGYYSCTAYNGARLWLPYPWQERWTARFVVDRFIFSGAVPHPARRNYMLSHVTGTIGLVCLTVLAFANGPIVGALALTVVSLVAICQTFTDWRKYRHLPAR